MPPITPEQLAEASARLDGLTEQFEKTVLEDICRRIAKAGTITDTAEWQMIRLKEMGYANDVIEKAIAEYTEKSEAEIRQLFFEAGQVSDDFYEKVYTQAGKGFTPLEDNPYMQQYIGAGIEQTKGELVNFTRSMGFAVRQADGTTAFLPVAKTYQSALDLAQMQVATGVFDYNTAVRNAVKSLTDSGLQFVDYASGHRNRADVAARRAILTGISQMTGKISEHNSEELETDIVETTAHAGARPDHAVWQGRWFSLSGKSKKYRSLREATGYGTGAGLKGWNCRHDFYPVIEGISEPTYTEEQLANIDPPPIEYNGKTLTYYKCTQRQRQMETAMRKTKREIIGAKASGDDDMLTAKSILLRRQKEEYANFSKEAGLLTQNERTQVYGFDRSIAQKAAWKARKAHKPLDNGGGKIAPKNPIISEKSSKDKQNVFRTKSELDQMPLLQLRNETAELARTWYESGKSGISFGDNNIDTVVNKLVDGSSRNSLTKDYMSLKKRISTLDNNGGSGIMNTTTNAVGHTVIITDKNSLKGPPNGITQTTNSKGGIDRNYYDSNGDQTKQITNHDHSHKAESKLGKHGEHAHDYAFNDEGKNVHGKPRELSDEERKENADIL